MYTNEFNSIFNMVFGLALIVGGFVFGKFSKASEQTKKGVSLGAYGLGGLAMAFHLQGFWRVLNGTYVPTEINLPSAPGASTADASYFTTFQMQTVELLGRSVSVAHLISVAAGIAIVVVGLMFKEKKWGKYATMLGAAAVLTGAFQMIF